MAEETKLESIFGWIGAIITIYFYISPIFPFSKVLKDQIDYQDTPAILLLCSFMNCIFWADYGLLKNISSLYIANCFGGAITLIWITIYLMYMGKKYFTLSFIINILLIIIIGIISYIFYFKIDEKITGLICMILNALTYAAPGEKMLSVIKNRKYEIFPIYSSIGIFGCSLFWLIYGFLQKDRNIIIPNALGIIFSIFQFIFFLIFYYKYNHNNKFKQENNKLRKDKKVNE